MSKDLITDFERAEFYKKAYIKANRKIVFFSILSFILGLVISRAYYLMF